jgi:hypothetical protein
MRRGRARVLGASVATGVTIALMALAFGGPKQAFPTGSPTPGSATPAPSGPTVFYELIDADASRLYARPLDGHSLARQVASRRDVDAGPAWSVDPTGTEAVVLVERGDDPDHQDLVAYDVASGAQRWSVPIPRTQTAAMTWSADGRQLAMATDSDAQDRRQLLLVDATSGALRSLELPANVSLDGIDADGAAILWQQLSDTTGDRVSFRFFRVDPATLAVEQLTSLPNVGPATEGDLSVSPAAGIAVDFGVKQDTTGFDLRVHDLRQNGATRPLVTLPSIELLAIDPGGAGVAASSGGNVRYVGLDGRGSNVFTGDAPISDLGWSADGAYLLVTTDGPPQSLWVVERTSGRTVRLPLPAFAEAHLVRVLGGVPLPPDALPAVEPSPSPTAGPSGGDVTKAPGLLASWIETANGRLVAHAQRLVPTEGGGIRVAASMPPIPLGPAPVPDDGTTEIRLVPRPGSDDILVWILSLDRNRGMIWDGGSGLRPLQLPPDWPANAVDVAWRPDGGALAASAERTTEQGDVFGVFVVAAPGAKRTTVIPEGGEYNRLEGWWSSRELRVGHGICTEGCTGVFSDSARLRVPDGRLIQLTPADRSRAALDSIYVDGDRLVLSMINDDRHDDLAVVWPAALGRPEDLDPLFPTDARSLLIARTTDTSTEVYRVDDVVGRAVGGLLANANPVLVGTIPGRSRDLSISPDGGWVVVFDRTGGASLVRLEDGRVWPLDRDRDWTWIQPG